MRTNILPVFGFILWIFVNGCTGVDTRAIDALFQEYDHDNCPGAVVAVWQQGQPIFEKCYGLADLERQVPVTRETNFRLASITKQFTAAAILILVDRGELTLDQTLATLFPELPSYAERITIRQVLNHTSGLVDYESVMADTATVQVHDRDVLDLVARVDSTYFEPGTQFSYSNSGYALLALTVERVSGRSFPEFLETEIFQPLGMTQTLAYVKGGPDIPNRAFGYHVTADTILFSDQSPTSAVLGDGGIYTSLADFQKWDQALYDFPLYDPELLEMAWTPALQDYGFGWRIDSFQGHRRIAHSGSTCGFRNIYARFPDEELSILILTNRRDPSVSDLAERIAEIVLNG